MLSPPPSRRCPPRRLISICPSSAVSCARLLLQRTRKRCSGVEETLGDYSRAWHWTTRAMSGLVYVHQTVSWWESRRECHRRVEDAHEGESEGKQWPKTQDKGVDGGAKGRKMLTIWFINCLTPKPLRTSFGRIIWPTPRKASRQHSTLMRCPLPPAPASSIHEGEHAVIYASQCMRI